MIESTFTTSPSVSHSFVPVTTIVFHPSHRPVVTVKKRAVENTVELPPAIPASYFRIKSLVDKVITAILMLAAIPILLIVAALILICDGRPIFFRQLRVGKNGKTFRILKFRTMRNGAEQDTGAVWSNPSDNRVTKLGRWLRCSHLDELPQFLNVLAGDMSLVGPRPERPEFVETLDMEVPGYMRRTEVKPGITGLAQLCLGYDVSVVGIPEKVKFDLEYIRTASLRQDVKLLASTLPYIAGQLYVKLRSMPKHQPLVRCPRTETCHSNSREAILR
ncbi:sugar transferase [Novipirellula sp. SH528]|uniref:sugar transferase n=1 Tax=Novipirellula sp. SH528 TaxID=3454466 RepID=UPI003FA16114